MSEFEFLVIFVSTSEVTFPESQINFRIHRTIFSNGLREKTKKWLKTERVSVPTDRTTESHDKVNNWEGLSVWTERLDYKDNKIS